MPKTAQLANYEESATVVSPNGDIPSTVLEIADANVKSALIAYLTTTALAHDIARQHGFTSSVLSYWARKLGLPLRCRGRRHLAQPTLRQRRILMLVQRYGIAAAARRIGRSRQFVHQIVGRWAPELRRVRTAPPVAYRRRRAGQQPRDFVVCFRVSEQELTSLAKARIPDTSRGLSANEKARKLVLRYLSLNRQPPHPFTPRVYPATDLEAAV